MRLLVMRLDAINTTTKLADSLYLRAFAVNDRPILQRINKLSGTGLTRQDAPESNRPEVDIHIRTTPAARSAITAATTP